MSLSVENKEFSEASVYNIFTTFSSELFPNYAIVHAVFEAKDRTLRRVVLFDKECAFVDKNWQCTVSVKEEKVIAICVTFLQKVDGGWSEYGRVRFLHRDPIKKSIQLCDSDATECGFAKISKKLPKSDYVPMRRLVGDLQNAKPCMLRDVYRRFKQFSLKDNESIRIVDDPWFFARSANERTLMEEYVQQTMNWFLEGGVVNSLHPCEPILHKAHMPMYNNNVLGMCGWAFILNPIIGNDHESTYVEAFRLANITAYAASAKPLKFLNDEEVREVMLRGLQFFAASLKYRSDTRLVGKTIKSVESFCHTARRDGVGDCEDHAYQLVVAACNFLKLELSSDSEIRKIQDYAQKFHFGLVLGTVSSTNTEAHAFNAAIDKRHFDSSDAGVKKERIVIMDGTNPLGERGILSDEYNELSKGFKSANWYRHLVCFMCPTTQFPEYFFTKDNKYGILLDDAQKQDFKASSLVPTHNFTKSFNFAEIKAIVQELLHVNRESKVSEKKERKMNAIFNTPDFENVSTRFTHQGLNPNSNLSVASLNAIGARRICLVEKNVRV